MPFRSCCRLRRCRNLLPHYLLKFVRSDDARQIHVEAIHFTAIHRRAFLFSIASLIHVFACIILLSVGKKCLSSIRHVELKRMSIFQPLLEIVQVVCIVFALRRMNVLRLLPLFACSPRYVRSLFAPNAFEGETCLTFLFLLK